MRRIETPLARYGSDPMGAAWTGDLEIGFILNPVRDWPREEEVGSREGPYARFYKPVSIERGAAGVGQVRGRR